MTIGLRTSWLQYPVDTFTSPYKITSQRRDSVDESTFGTLNDSTLPPARQSLVRPQSPRRAYGSHSLRPHSPAEPMDPFRLASSAPSPPGEGNAPQPALKNDTPQTKSLPRARGRGTALAVEEVHGLAGSSQTHFTSTTKRRTPAHGEGGSRRLTEEVLSLMRCEVKEVKVDIYLFGRYNKSMIVSFRDKDRKNISIRFSKETEDYH